MKLDEKTKADILKSDDAGHLEALTAVFSEAAMLAHIAQGALADGRSEDAGKAITQLCELVFPIEDALVPAFRKLVPLELPEG